MMCSGKPKNRWRQVVLLVLLSGGLALLMAGALLRPLWYLPEPAQADQDALLRWLALRDLEQYPREVQVALVNRFQSDVNPRELVQHSGSRRESARRYAPRIQKNAGILKKIWFETRCREYAACEPALRYEFLDEQLNAVFDWSSMLAAANTANSPSAANADAPQASQLLKQIDQWIDQAPPSHQADMRRAVQDATICWLSSADLRATSPQTTRYIAQRLSAQLGQSDFSSREPLPLTDAQHRMLQQNAMVLVEAWIHWQAEQYAELASEQRQAMVDACLDQVHSWRLEKLLAGGSARGSNTIWSQVATHLPEWLQQGQPAERERLQAFLAHLQQRFFWRSLQRLTLPGASKQSAESPEQG